ncbi:SDR family oxidoreductase [Micromonospora sp. NPDC049559]|uniref:SDR family NAD(P)-dependent oxidoreductase n=1 Tax=Micromonospora sp. NPDC049559 TaxID=3155923 RepID=UPI003412C22D
MSARTFVVDGGTSGLGYQVARMLAPDNRVVVLGNVAQEVDAVREELGCDGVVCDVSQPEQVRDALDGIVARHGKIDGLAHCAARWAGGHLDELTPEMITMAIQVNVLGTALLLREALIQMHRQGYGNIVYVSALATEVPRPGIPIYRATKSFGTSLVESLAEAQGTNSIKIMEIHPGPMPTRLQERTGDQFLDEVYALPEQVAAEVVRLLLLSSDDLYVSGQKVLRADGRW